MQLYYRIYYTIYRGLIWFGQSHETDMIRMNVVFMLSLSTMFIAVSVIGLLIGIIGTPFIFNSTFQSVVFLLSILAINAYAIFYKKKYQEVESQLALTWAKMKSFNIILTAIFIIGSIVLFYSSLIYIKAHSLAK